MKERMQRKEIKRQTNGKNYTGRQIKEGIEDGRDKRTKRKRRRRRRRRRKRRRRQGGRDKEDESKVRRAEARMKK